MVCDYNSSECLETSFINICRDILLENSSRVFSLLLSKHWAILTTQYDHVRNKFCFTANMGLFCVPTTFLSRWAMVLLARTAGARVLCKRIIWVCILIMHSGWSFLWKNSWNDHSNDALHGVFLEAAELWQRRISREQVSFSYLDVSNVSSFSFSWEPYEHHQQKTMNHE